MYKTDRVAARFSVVSVQGSELPEVQPVASVLSLLGRVPVRSQALDRPILDLNYPIRSQGWTGRFEYTSIPKLDATEIHYCLWPMLVSRHRPRPLSWHQPQNLITRMILLANMLYPGTLLQESSLDTSESTINLKKSNPQWFMKRLMGVPHRLC